MLTYNGLYHSELTKLLNEEIERVKDNLTTAHYIEGFDFAEYKRMVGKIEGLRMALELSVVTETIVNGKM